MHLIGVILNDLMDNNISLTVPLSKTKVLATRINNQDLLAWVNKELGGYGTDDSVPRYRITQGKLKGDFLYGNRQGTNIPITLETNNKTHQRIHTAHFKESVAQLENLSKSESRMLKYEFHSPLTRSIEKLLQEVNGPYFQLFSAGLAIPTGFVREILSSIHSRLLDLILALETEFGVEAEISTLKSNNDFITNYVITTINNNGDGNVTNTGANTNLNAKISISKGDKEKLKNELMANEIANEDINTLLSIIDTEKIADNGVFGEKVNGWVKTMLSKALEGSWNIGISAAGGILANAIEHYYGA
jgi:hypothetical protein